MGSPPDPPPPLVFLSEALCFSSKGQPLGRAIEVSHPKTMQYTGPRVCFSFAKWEKDCWERVLVAHLRQIKFREEDLEELIWLSKPSLPMNALESLHALGQTYLSSTIQPPELLQLHHSYSLQFPPPHLDSGGEQHNLLNSFYHYVYHCPSVATGPGSQLCVCWEAGVGDGGGWGVVVLKHCHHLELTKFSGWWWWFFVKSSWLTSLFWFHNALAFFPFLFEKHCLCSHSPAEKEGKQLLISMQSLPWSSSVERTPLLKHRSCLCSEGEKLKKQIDLFLQVMLPHPTGVGRGCPISMVVGPIAFFPTGTNLHGNCCSVLAGLF